MRITFRDDTRCLEFTLDEYATWTEILEDAVFPALRGMGYILPRNDKLAEVIHDVWEDDREEIWEYVEPDEDAGNE